MVLDWAWNNNTIQQNIMQRPAADGTAVDVCALLQYAYVLLHKRNYAQHYCTYLHLQHACCMHIETVYVCALLQYAYIYQKHSVKNENTWKSEIRRWWRPGSAAVQHTHNLSADPAPQAPMCYDAFPGGGRFFVLFAVGITFLTTEFMCIFWVLYSLIQYCICAYLFAELVNTVRQ